MAMKQYFKNLHNTSNEMVKNEKALEDVFQEALKTLNQSEGRVFFLATGLTGFMIKDFLHSLSYLFKWDKERLLVIIPGQEHNNLTEDEEWRNYEDLNTVGALEALELNLNKNDLLVSLTTTEKTRYIHGLLFQAKVNGSKVIQISSAKETLYGKDEEKDSIIDKHIHIPLSGKSIENLFIGNHNTVLKASAEYILLRYFEESGQIIDDNILTINAWTGKLRHIAYTTLLKSFPDLTEAKAIEYFEKCNNDMAAIYIILEKGLTYAKAKKLLKDNKYNIKKVLELV